MPGLQVRQCKLVCAFYLNLISSIAMVVTSDVSRPGSPQTGNALPVVIIVVKRASEDCDGRVCDQDKRIYICHQASVINRMYDTYGK